MEQLLAAEIAGVPIVAGLLVAILIWQDLLLTVDARRRLPPAAESPSAGYLVGRFLGLWIRSALYTVFGITCLWGSMVMFLLFVVATLWRVIQPARDFALGFAQGVEGEGGQAHTASVSAAGAAYGSITRGLPLLFLYASLHAA